MAEDIIYYKERYCQERRYVNITAVPGTLIQNSIAEDDETNRSRRLALLRTALSSCPIVAKD